MTPEVFQLAKDIAALIGTGGAAFYLAWKARGRKDLRKPYSPEKGAQPRMVTRDEWHGAVQIINAWPGLSSKVAGIDDRLRKVETNFEEHIRKSNDTMESFFRLEAAFLEHVKRWEEAGRRATSDREETRRDIQAVSAKVDALLLR